jgi:hypothetical protein
MSPLAALMRALRGPIMLIALGSLLAIQQATSVGLSKTWPALLILLGLTKLAERLASRAPVAENVDSQGGQTP